MLTAVEAYVRGCELADFWLHFVFCTVAFRGHSYHAHNLLGLLISVIKLGPAPNFACKEFIATTILFEKPLAHALMENAFVGNPSRRSHFPYKSSRLLFNFAQRITKVKVQDRASRHNKGLLVYLPC